MALSEREGGFSTILRISLLLLICVVILECEAAPGAVGMDGAKAREPPEEEKLAELDLMTGQGMGKSRSKRDAIPIDTIPLAISRNYDHRMGHSNSKTERCAGVWSGEDPFTPAETKAFRDFALVTFKVEHLNPLAEQGDAAKENGKCVSGKCSFDPTTSGFICGPVKEGIFENGKHCFDGLDPPSYQTDVLFNDQDKINKETNDNYGKWCKSGKCWAQFVDAKKPPTYICSSSSVEPILLLLVTLFGLCVLRNLQ